MMTTTAGNTAIEKASKGIRRNLLHQQQPPRVQRHGAVRIRPVLSPEPPHVRDRPRFVFDWLGFHERLQILQQPIEIEPSTGSPPF